jgi:ankyrin repeat protein
MSGFTPLMRAAYNHSNPAVLLVLIESGADVNVADEFGRKAFDFIKFKSAFEGTDAYNLLREKTLPYTGK